MSKVRLCGLNQGNHCGYCKGYGSSSYGLDCKLMRASDYEAMMLKGWRRCGSYYYKPDIPRSCCKLNTIRCDALNFKPNKSQRKVFNKFQNFINGTRNDSESKKTKKKNLKSQIPADLEALISKSLIQAVSGICEYHPDYLKITKNSENRVIQFGHYSITSCLVISGRNKSINKEALHSKLTETISEALEGTQFSILNTKNFHVNLHDSSPAPSESSEVKPMELEGEKHEYSTEIVPADFTEESFEVYKEYQINVHHDSPSSLSKSGYSNFLCGKNIIQEKPSENHPLGLGNFHQLHRIDGKLVAVGVLDFLPSGVSSVYFFYSPKYQHLSMGVFSALKEIELIQQNKSETFKYYYMGFYIDTCQKMRYKGEYLPSQLLCPKNYVWVDIEKCLEMKAAHRFIELHQCSPQTAGTQDDDMNWQGIDFLKFLKDHLKVEYQGNIMKFESFNSNGQNFIIKLMMEAQNFLSKWMVQRLVFKLG